MRHINKFTPLALLSLTLFILSCATVPLTGRKQLNLIPATQLNSLSYSEYSEFMSSHQKSNNMVQTKTVRTVGGKIQSAVEQFFKQNGMSSHLNGYKWEFNLIEDNSVNAWCMPGGKVVVYTGILPVTQNEDGLAVVMGHEIAHAVANHGNERMSQGLMATTGAVVLDEALKNKKQETRELFALAYGVGVQVGALLPYSRLHESEADRMGLIFMAMAGYDPNESIKFWTRMSKQGGGSGPEFLSTHPSDETRIKNLKKALPEAMKYYRK